MFQLNKLTVFIHINQQVSLKFLVSGTHLSLFTFLSLCLSLSINTLNLAFV